MTRRRRDGASREVEIRRKYLEESFTISIRRARERWMRFADEVTQGREELKLVRDNALRDVEALERRRDEKLGALDNLAVVVERKGRVPRNRDRRADRGCRLRHAARRRGRGRRNGRGDERASASRAGSRPTSHGCTTAQASTSAASAQQDEHGQRAVRRIEVKGRAGENLPVELTPNEWVQAGRHRETFWLYVVWNAKTSPELAARSRPGCVASRRRRGAAGRERLSRAGRGDREGGDNERPATHRGVPAGRRGELRGDARETPPAARLPHFHAAPLVGATAARRLARCRLRRACPARQTRSTRRS